MIGVGVAQLYPNLTLSGLISTVAASAARLGTVGTVSWSFGPTIDFAIFEGGKRRAQVAVYRSRGGQAYLAWKSTVLAAVGEVEKALTAYGNERKRKASLEAAVARYAEAAALADERYRTGAGDFLDVLEAQRSLHTARDALAESETQVALYFIALNVAVGGGWSAGTGAER
jgi:multidrug efflux system outer membrane protein